jgi:hypothetical protein
MNRNVIFYMTKIPYVLFLIILTSCTEVLVFDDTVVITGRVITRDEFGIEKTDNNNVLVSINNTNLKTSTNANGYFTFNEVPLGTFDLIFTKEGYGARTVRYYNVAPGRDTLRMYDVDILQPSSIEIQNFRVEEEGSVLYAKGTIIHKFPYIRPDSYHRSPMLIVYSNDKEDVSTTHYLRYISIEVPLPTNSEFNIRLHGIYTPYRKDETYYYLAYGASVYNYLTDRYYDKEKESSISVSTIFGKPSNVFSLIGKY